MSPSPALKLSILGMLALSLTACSLTGSTEPTSGPTVRPTVVATMTPTPNTTTKTTDTDNSVKPTGNTVVDGGTKDYMAPSPATTTAPTSADTSMKEYTATQVAEHNSGTSCYVSFQGQVYDITSFIPKHPDGPKPLAKCGQSIDSFSDVHSGGNFDSPQMQKLLSTQVSGTLNYGINPLGAL